VASRVLLEKLVQAAVVWLHMRVRAVERYDNLLALSGAHQRQRSRW